LSVWCGARNLRGLRLRARCEVAAPQFAAQRLAPQPIEEPALF
jgi:hypothetical protein